MGGKIKVAACQMVAELGNVPENLVRAEQLIEAAFAKGAQWVILPEFFPSAMAFHPSMVRAPLPLEGPVLRLFTAMAHRHGGYVGGSFVCSKGADRYNTFVLVRPDGSYVTHDKHFPSWWENCYYIPGETEGVFTADELRVGAALCWELARRETAERLKGKIDFVVGGSCWFALPEPPLLKKFIAQVQDYNCSLIREAPARLARILGVPLVHASHAGWFKGRIPMTPLPFKSYYQGETRIVDGLGQVLARMSCEEGAGVITAEIEPGPVPPTDTMGDGVWLPLASAPFPVKAGWHLSNSIFALHGKLYYRWMKWRGLYR
jgi:predicted amidohydrolase